MPDQTSDPLGHLDPGVRRRVAAQAEVIVARLLRQREQDRPQRFRTDVYFSHGTVGFDLLHRFVQDVTVFCALFNEALQQQQSADTEPALRFSPLDPALTAQYDGYVGVMLHPAEMNVTNLQDVPPELRFFQLNTRPPHDIAESTAASPQYIARKRELTASPLKDLHERWRTEREALGGRLLEIVRAECKRQAKDLRPEVLAAINDLLARAMAYPGYHMLDTLQAASYLGIFPQIAEQLGQG